MLDGRRLWIVSASVHFQRIDRDLWADRIHAAKLAGFNTIETPVFWAPIETRAGQFDFSGSNDIKTFANTVHAAGLKMILRVGPFIGSGWDLGGLPSWLLNLPDARLRTQNQPFLEACSRYFTALAEQVRPRQVTATGKGGPIMLIQNESKWTCGDDALAKAYLGELTRYLRENGLQVPKINANNLWQGEAVEDEIDGWTGTEHMLSTVRQLAVVRPDQPRVVIDFGHKDRDVMDERSNQPMSPAATQRRLAEILSGGGQFNLNPFCAGLTRGFWAGRASDADGGPLGPVQDRAAPIDPAGAPSESFHLIRRVATFASQFGRVLANLNPEHQPIVLDPSEQPHPVGKAPAKNALAPVVAHASGTQGDVAFVYTGGDDQPTARSAGLTRVGLLLPDGTQIPVDLGRQSVAWCLFNVNLQPRATLDYCSLNAFAMLGDVFVCYGPAGGTGVLSINGSPIEVTVPKGRQPLVEELEGIHVVVCSGDLVDETFLADDAVYVGVSSVSAAGEPRPGSGKTATRISKSGEVSTVTPQPAPAVRGLPKGGKAKLDDIAGAPTTDQSEGVSPRFASIAGPAGLNELGAPYGYGWYRLTFRASAAKKHTIAAPGGGDRLHIMLDGEPVGILGSTPGASPTLGLQLKKGARTITVLADNLGRLSDALGEEHAKGPVLGIHSVTPFKAGRVSTVEGEPVEPLAHFAPLMEMRVGDTTSPARVGWAFQHRKKNPIILRLEPLPERCVLIVNGEPKKFLERGRVCEVVLDDEILKRGGNDVRLSPVIDTLDLAGADARVKAFAAAVTSGSTLLESTGQVAGNGDWSFAKWETPKKSAFKADATASSDTRPCWWRARFDDQGAGRVPVELDLTGLSKGVVYVNGQCLGRYFVSTASGDKPGDAAPLPLPAPLLKPAGNEVIFFDEHGRSPSRCRVVYRSDSAPIRADDPAD